MYLVFVLLDISVICLLTLLIIKRARLVFRAVVSGDKGAHVTLTFFLQGTC